MLFCFETHCPRHGELNNVKQLGPVRLISQTCSILFQDSSFRGIRTTSRSQHQSGRLQQSTCPGWSSWFPKKPAQCDVASRDQDVSLHLYTFVMSFSPVTVEVTFVVTSKFVNRTSVWISPFHIEVHENVPCAHHEPAKCQWKRPLLNQGIEELVDVLVILTTT